MSEHIARSVISRMHLRELAIAAHYPGLASDLRALAATNTDAAQQAFMDRRNELVAAYGFNPSEQRKPFAFSNGVAIIPVHGTLINRFSYSWGVVTGYNFIRQQTALAGQDPDVQSIVFDVNSYGGEAAGCFECSADIRGLANGKPTMSIVDSNAYSGGYAIAAGTDRITLTPSGGVGSIGVVVTHVSYEKLLEDAGIKITFIHAGEHKVDGNPYEDLSASVKTDIQKGVDATYDQFVGLVAAGRKKKMTEKSIRDTEARIYRAEDALSIGLIDAIAAPSEAMRAFMGELTGSNQQSRNSKEDAMSDASKPGDNKAAQEDLVKAQADAAKAERARVSGIQTCEEAKGREALASHLAFNTEMSVDAAKAILAAAPKASEQQATGTGFKAAMDAGQHPNVGADAGAGGDPNDKPSRVAALLQTARSTGIVGFHPAKK